METVLDALMAMKKASSIEIAARTGTDKNEVINQLWALKRDGKVDLHGRCWSLPDAAAVPKSSRSESELTKKILAALADEIQISTEFLTKKLGRKPNSLNSTLGALAKEGLVDRHVDKNNITWSLPGAAEPAVMDQQEAEAEHRTVSAVLESITPFAAPRPDDLLIPTVRGVNREIRRARAKVVQLEKLRDAVRELGKHKRLIREVLL